MSLRTLSTSLFTSKEEEVLLGAQKRQQFERNREQILKKIPVHYKDLFNQIGFVHWDTYILPVLVVNPFDVPPRPFRAQWLRSFVNVQKDGLPVAEESASLLVYWYGDTDPTTCYSLIKPARFMSYKEAEERGQNKLPLAVRKRSSAKRLLSSSDQDLVRAFREMETDLIKVPCDRKHGVVFFDEDYGMLVKVAQELGFDKASKVNGKQEKFLNKKHDEVNEVDAETFTGPSGVASKRRYQTFEVWKHTNSTEETEQCDSFFQSRNDSGLEIVFDIPKSLGGSTRGREEGPGDSVQDVYLSEEDFESISTAETTSVGASAVDSPQCHHRVYSDIVALVPNKISNQSRKYLLEHVQGIVQAVTDGFVEDTLAQLPHTYKEMFDQIGFVNSLSLPSSEKKSSRLLPIIVISPFDILPRSIRMRWFRQFIELKAKGCADHEVTWIVFHYGSCYQQSYSIIQSKDFIAYQHAKKSGKHELPKLVQTKLLQRQDLSRSEEELVRAFRDMQEDLVKETSGRTRGSVASRDDHQPLSVNDIFELEQEAWKHGDTRSTRSSEKEEEAYGSI